MQDHIYHPSSSVDVRDCRRLLTVYVKDVDVRARYTGQSCGGRKKWKERKKITLSFSLVKRFLFSRRVFTRPANKRSNWSTRDLRIDLRILISGRALTDLKLPPRSCDARYISSSLYLSVSICLVYFISLYPSVLFSLAVILAVMLRLPTRVSRVRHFLECVRKTKRRSAKPLSKF